MNRPKRLVAAEGLCRPEPVMTIARSAADVLASHVTLEVECIDRMYLNVYQPRLQFVEGVVSFLRHHRDLRAQAFLGRLGDILPVDQDPPT